MIPIVEKLLGMVGGGLVDTAMSAIKTYFPPSMSEEEKAELELKVSGVLHGQQMDLQKTVLAIDVEFNQRIKDLEGTSIVSANVSYFDTPPGYKGSVEPGMNEYTFVAHVKPEGIHIGSNRFLVAV